MGKSRIPEVGEFVRKHGTLVGIEVVPPQPVPPETDYIFEEIEARCEIRLINGEVIQEVQTLNDYYGFETSVKVAIKEMESYAASRNLGVDSDVEVVVVRVATQYRKRVMPANNFYDETFFDCRSLDMGSRRGLPAPVETVVWSSKTGRQESVEDVDG